MLLAACGEIPPIGPDPIVGVWRNVGAYGSSFEVRGSGDIYDCLYGENFGRWRSIGFNRYELVLIDPDAGPYDPAKAMRGEQAVSTARATVDGDLMHIVVTSGNSDAGHTGDEQSLKRVTDPEAIAECD
jgi:hypothetical protein